MSAPRHSHLADAVRGSIRSMAAEINGKSRDLRSEFGNQTLQISLVQELIRARCRSHMMADEPIAKVQAALLADIDRGNGLCESPLERIVLPWLLGQDYGKVLEPICAKLHVPKGESGLSGSGVHIVPQFAFARFRVDFAVVGRSRGHTKIVAVECDGVDFHDPVRDAARDSYLRSWGIETIRMGGADISRNPSSIARRAASMIIEWADSIGVPYG